jgi:phage terminase small subunit
MTTRPDNVAPIFGGSGRHKPDAIKDVQGTFRPDRAKAEANYTKVDREIVPLPPEWMVDPEAKKYYVEAFELLRDSGVMTFADVGLVEIYACERAAIQRRYEQMYRVGEDANGNPVYEVVLAMAPGTEKLNAFRMLSSELGFSPVSRHKVVAQKGKKGKDDPWGDM